MAQDEPSNGTEAIPVEQMHRELVEPIQVNTDAITLDDLVFLEEWGEGKVAKMRDIRDFFNRVVVGGAGGRKYKELVTIATAIMNKMAEESNPKGKG